MSKTCLAPAFILVIQPTNSNSRNFRSCDSGYSSCGESLLTTAQQAQVHKSQHSRNFRSCDSGYSSCDLTLLTQQQHDKVKLSALARNFASCDRGYSGCDTALLTAAQRAQVDASGRTRNFHSCNSGYSGCDASILTDVQRTTVTESASRRNAYNCQKGYSSCVHTVRTSESLSSAPGRSSSSPHARTRDTYITGGQQASFETAKSASTKPKAPTALGPDAVETVVLPVAAGPTCAENGSCYGDISSATLRPKTTHVSGYTRRDGTYVRGHYRSK